MVRRWHGREFKLEAVRLVREGGASAAQIARDLGVHPHLLHKWTKEFEVDPEHSFPGKGKMNLGSSRSSGYGAKCRSSRPSGTS
jgi:transposase